jgi:hypothetical protein
MSRSLNWSSDWNNENCTALEADCTTRPETVTNQWPAAIPACRRGAAAPAWLAAAGKSDENAPLLRVPKLCRAGCEDTRIY